jgi:AraC-like DNA-binding protein
LEIQAVRLGPGQEWGPEPDQWRFVFLESGTAYWLEAGKPRELAGGELLVLSPSAQGPVRASQLGEVMLQWFGFRPDGFLGFLTMRERQWIENSATEAVGPVGWLPSTHPICRQMWALFNSGNVDGDLVARAKALVLTLSVFSQFIPQSYKQLGSGGGAKERFEEIIARMPDSEFIRYSSEDLARLCGCTPRHFNRLFRRSFGTPTRVRQTELRLLKARQLLQTSTESVAQIAWNCGYRSLRLFNSLFCRRFGMSPSECRQKRAL